MWPAQPTEQDWAQLARQWAAQRGAVPIVPYPGVGGGYPLEQTSAVPPVMFSDGSRPLDIPLPPPADSLDKHLPNEIYFPNISLPAMPQFNTFDSQLSQMQCPPIEKDSLTIQPSVSANFSSLPPPYPQQSIPSVYSFNEPPPPSIWPAAGASSMNPQFPPSGFVPFSFPPPGFEHGVPPNFASGALPPMYPGLMPPRPGGRALPSWLREEIRKRTQTEPKVPDEQPASQPHESLLTSALAPFSTAVSHVAPTSPPRPTDTSEGQSSRSRWEETEGTHDAAQSGVMAARTSTADTVLLPAAAAENHEDEPDSDMETEAAAAKEKQLSAKKQLQLQPPPLSDEEKSALLMQRVRAMMTDVLLEATARETQEVALEVLARARQRARRRRRAERRTTAPNQSHAPTSSTQSQVHTPPIAIAGIAAYGSESDSESEPSDAAPPPQAAASRNSSSDSSSDSEDAELCGTSTSEDELEHQRRTRISNWRVRRMEIESEISELMNPGARTTGTRQLSASTTTTTSAASANVSSEPKRAEPQPPAASGHIPVQATRQSEQLSVSNNPAPAKSTADSAPSVSSRTRVASQSSDTQRTGKLDLRAEAAKVAARVVAAKASGVQPREAEKLAEKKTPAANSSVKNSTSSSSTSMSKANEHNAKSSPATASKRTHSSSSSSDSERRSSSRRHEHRSSPGDRHKRRDDRKRPHERRHSRRHSRSRSSSKS